MKKIKEIALEKLSVDCSQAAFFDFVRWVDEEFCLDKTKHGIPHTHGIAQQIATRAIIAVGHYMIEKRDLNSQQKQNMSKTIKSASEYALLPNDSNLDKYFFDATNSYPFGAGEGCYSVMREEFNDGCKPGSGCKSGLGGIVDLMNNETAFSVIQKELIPWLKGISEPISLDKGNY